MIWFYRTVLFFAAPVILGRLFWRSRKNPSYKQRLIERSGKMPTTPQPHGIWVHSVSVGESIAAIPLIEQLIDLYPDKQITVTCTTPTGSSVIQKQFAARVHHSYVPYDYQVFVNRFLDQAQPAMLIIMETELWPNLLKSCHARGIKTLIANLRLSDQSFRSYRRLQSLFKPIMDKVDGLAAQTQSDAKKVAVLGARKERINVVGSLKYDGFEPQDQKEQQDLQLHRQLQPEGGLIWVAGSTHEGEEEPILAVHQALLEQAPNTLLVLAPRHPERFHAVRQMVQQRFDSQSWSEVRSQQALAAQTRVLVLDTIGELRRFISLSRFCFVGGSLVEVGGHNLLEACHAGVPVLFGPHMHNSPQVAADVVAAQAGFQVDDQAQLQEKCLLLTRDKALRGQMGQNAAALIIKNKGALQATLNMIEELLSR